MRKASPEYKSREAKQRRLVRERDRIGGKSICLMERRTKRGWERCGRVVRIAHTVHIIRRQQCGEYWDAPEVGILGCEDCHRVYDHNYLGDAPFEVRVPYEYSCTAWDFLAPKVGQKGLIVAPNFRYNPYENDVYADVRSAA